MRRILFLCHGNICRSPMAEFIAKDLIEKYNLKDISVESKALSYEEEGNSIDYRAKRCMDIHNIKYGNHYSHRFEKEDYDKYDEIYYMDDYNYNRLINISSDPNNKYHKLLEKDVDDPWYTGDFETTYNELVFGIKKILNLS